ncbi:MAG: type III polyketide synthase [Elusimicrobia bacterium]|nr:type III polyketide synthase [Elusimicrobiota bacterium]
MSLDSPTLLPAPARRRSRPPATRLYGIGTAVGRHRLTQSRALGFTSRVARANAGDPALEETLGRLERIYKASRIETRHSVLPDFCQEDPADFSFFPKNWALDPFPGTAARMKAYEAESVALAEAAARRALAASGVSPAEVTHLLITTCTGFFAPGPEILLMGRLGLPPTVKRTLIGFMGCYAGINGLRAADDIVRAWPEAVVLQVSVELCTLHFQKGASPGLQFANALFSDGAAAAVYAGRASRDGGIADLAATHCRVSPDSLEQMSWRIGDSGFEMRLDRRIPASLSKAAAPFASELLEAAGLQRSEAAGWAVHPGGHGIVAGVQKALGLDDSQVSASLEVLRGYGNMSSATIFFVLERALLRSRGPVAALGFGPGLTMEGAVLAAG